MIEVTQVTDADLIAKLTVTEDPFTERKSSTDKNGWLKTVVAFANSTPVGHVAVLYVGVNNSGIIASGNRIEDLMKSFSDFIEEHAFPTVYTYPRELKYGGKSCLAVVVPGSANRPHVAGKFWVRDGTQTRDATEEQLVRLISERESKAFEIRRYLGQRVSCWRYHIRNGIRRMQRGGAEGVLVVDCNRHYILFADGEARESM